MWQAEHPGSSWSTEGVCRVQVKDLWKAFRWRRKNLDKTSEAPGAGLAPEAPGSSRLPFLVLAEPGQNSTPDRRIESIKSKQQYFEPDPRSRSLAPPLENQYELLDYFRLHEGVPEQVRNYMNSVVTLWLYAWLYYPFYPLTIFLSATAVEMALEERFPKKRGRGLGKLLQIAKEAGLLSDEGFSSLKHRLENAAMLDRRTEASTGKGPQSRRKLSSVDVVTEALSKVRNSFAHPKMHTIVAPGMTVDGLIVAAEIINQLWPAPRPS